MWVLREEAFKAKGHRETEDACWAVITSVMPRQMQSLAVRQIQLYKALVVLSPGSKNLQLCNMESCFFFFLGGQKTSTIKILKLSIYCYMSHTHPDICKWNFTYGFIAIPLKDQTGRNVENGPVAFQFNILSQTASMWSLQY